MIPVQYNLRSLAVRKATTVATATGIALVVFVLAASMMLAAGVKKTLAVGGRADTAVVIRRGSDAEMGSVLDVAELNRILGAPGVKRDAKDKPTGTGEVVMVTSLEKIGTDGGVTNVQLRGVTEGSKELRPEVHVVDGRPARPGSDEVIIGARLRGRFKNMEIGKELELRKNRPVKVVGVFESGGSSNESEVWVDIDVLRQSFGIEGGVSSVRVKLTSPAAFDNFRAAMEGDKAFGYTTMRETVFLEKLSEGTSTFVTVLGIMVSIFFAVGAMIGAMITMYAAVANRQREIGTLRALGFSRTSILGCFLLESVLLALLGGAVGAAASLAMGLVHFSMLNRATFSEIVFSFEPTPRIIATALSFAAMMGLFGGLFPSLHASRVSPVTAMRGG